MATKKSCGYGYGDGDGDGDGDAEIRSWRSNGVNGSRPSWLQTTLADLDDKMKTLALNLQEEDDSDTFGERAENYYRKRPLLFNLLQHLYNSYLSLADRYCQSLIQLKQRDPHLPSSSSSICTVQTEITDYGWYDQDPHPQSESEAESTLSYQHPPPSLDIDTIVSQLVIKTVDCEILLQELGVQEQSNTESSRKMELQKSLLEVLESERLILLNENARLGYQVTTLAEENKGLASESMLMRRKASELARCVLKMREDHRVCLLSRKIEDLQGQINGLEKRNREYYAQLVRREEEEKNEKNKKNRAVALEMCFEVEKIKLENQRLRLKEEAMVNKARKQGWKRGVVPTSKWWGKFRKLDVFLACGNKYDS
ncbi:Kinase-interacting family protein [Thalictrum thalictroides]|uniref:Kinase-interacting family protein n=1 Tax=Thalictrum thalictroides TaxID=46969 RepID=A0A7J6WQQ8_THATH|nr:Kinase-interacting family protein [Thalictrum thalictroides]